MTVFYLWQNRKLTGDHIGNNHLCLPGANRPEELEVTDGVSNVRFLGNCILKEKGYLGRLCEYLAVDEFKTFILGREFHPVGN
jgi:hypothetical protein